MPEHVRGNLFEPERRQPAIEDMTNRPGCQPLTVSILDYRPEPVGLRSLCQIGSDMGMDRQMPIGVALATPDGKRAVCKIDMLPSERGYFCAAQTGVPHKQ